MANCELCETANDIIKRQTKLLEQAQKLSSDAVDKTAELNVRLQEEIMRISRLTAIAVTAARMVDVNDPEMATQLLNAIDVATRRS